MPDSLDDSPRKPNPDDRRSLWLARIRLATTRSELVAVLLALLEETVG